MEAEYTYDVPPEDKPVLDSQLLEFTELFLPKEGKLYIFCDEINKAVFCECHIFANLIVSNGTIDSPLDAENQAEYRANRDVAEDDTAFLRMIDDAKHRRSFSNIVAEYNTAFDAKHPLKIIGGQHRYLAIKDALNNGINQLHGIKVYFNLNTDQRLDVQLISNTNISVSSDLLDRMMETVKGPQLRTWCQKAGLLHEHEDFADRKQRGSRFTVRAARTFIMNFYNGVQVKDQDFAKTKTIPILAKTGRVDEDWEKLKIEKPDMWDDSSLLNAGQAFSQLICTQRGYYTENDGKVSNLDYADKASSYAIVAAWAYVAGCLQDNPTRLARHYNLSSQAKADPLNAKVLAKARHKTDLDNYRGLGTRTDAKERGRMAELFYFQAEKGSGITKELADAAIARYHAKQALLEALEAESKV